MKRVLSDRKLVLIFFVGLLLRILFLVYGARIYYGTSQKDIFTNGDTHSFIWTFENLWWYGRYTFDFLEPDAAFGRLPGYPFFYGLHYILFGPAYAKLATACTQVLLDSSSILLVFKILQRLKDAARLRVRLTVVPYIGAALYATYPFVIVWVSIIGTETLATFLTLACLAWLLRPNQNAAQFLWLGLLLAVAFYVREYLGILVPISLGYLFLSYKRLPKASLGQVVPRRAVGVLTALLLSGGTFGIFYSLWPIRNYISFHRIVLIKPKTAGYANYNVDFAGFRSWVFCWTNDEQSQLEQVANTDSNSFPAGVFANAAEAAEARRGAQLARACGSSFYLYRNKIYGTAIYRNVAAMRSNQAYQQNCNAEISRIFEALRLSYIRRHPVLYWVNVPAHDVYKALFKSNKNATSGSTNAERIKTLLIRALFAWRSLLVILGFIGVLMFRRNRKLWPAVLFVGFMYVFLCFIMRNLEMRYLLQADAVLLLPAAMLLGELVDRLLDRPSAQIPLRSAEAA